jgi:hypothetical protein
MNSTAIVPVTSTVGVGEIVGVNVGEGVIEAVGVQL